MFKADTIVKYVCAHSIQEVEAGWSLVINSKKQSGP